MEQRVNLKFLVKLGKKPTECVEMLHIVYGDDCMSCARVFEWHKRFKSGREDVEDDPKSGRPSTSTTADNIDRENRMVRGDRRLTVRMIAYELGMNKETVRTILTEDLGMRKVCAKMVPKLLTDDHKDIRTNVCRNILQMIEEEPDFLGKVITGDETWVFQYDPETTRQSLQWKTPAKTKEGQNVEVENQGDAHQIF